MKLMKHNKAKTEALTPVPKAWPLFWPLSRLQNQIDQLFEQSFDGWPETMAAPLGTWVPAVDVFEDKDKVVVKTELPGMKKEEIEVYMAGDSLNIAGERKQEADYQTGAAHRVERYFGRFHRCVSLPVAVDAKRIEAHYKDGVLTISCPKTEEAKQRQIEIKIS